MPKNIVICISPDEFDFAGDTNNAEMLELFFRMRKDAGLMLEMRERMKSMGIDDSKIDYAIENGQFDAMSVQILCGNGCCVGFNEHREAKKNENKGSD